MVHLSVFITCISIILICTAYIIYRFATDKHEMVLDKGGIRKDDLILPDFSRTDIQAFFKECHETNIPEKLAKEFIIALYNTLLFNSEPESPKLNDDRYDIWALDDDVDYPINYVLEKYGVNEIRWNQKDVLELQTIKDILVFITGKVQSKS